MTKNLVSFKEACAAVRGTKLFILDTSGHNQRGYSYALVPLVTKTVGPEMTFCGYDEITEEPIYALCPPKPVTYTYPDRENALMQTRENGMKLGFEREQFMRIVAEEKLRIANERRIKAERKLQIARRQNHAEAQ